MISLLAGSLNGRDACKTATLRTVIVPRFVLTLLNLCGNMKSYYGRLLSTIAIAVIARQTRKKQHRMSPSLQSLEEFLALLRDRSWYGGRAP
jgi:hypothetical protein